MARFQILSLDGGGIRGAFIAAFLADIERRYQTRITDHFDIITGTSTGGIVAIGLGMGLSAGQIQGFYAENGPSIFPSLIPPSLRRIPFSGLLEPRNYRSLLRRKFSNKPLQEALDQALDGKPLGRSTTRLVIPAYDLQRNAVKLFKTAHHERFRSDYLLSASEVALATSAAPTFFQAASSANRFFVDGGLWANDPIMVGISEAIGVLGQAPEDLRVLSIGTLDEVRALAKTRLSGGMAFWAKPAIDSIMTGQSTGAQGQAKLLLGSDNILRVSPSVPAGHYKLDDASCIDELIGIASGEAEHQSPRIHESFLNHHAAPFTPVYEVPAHA